MREKAKKHWFLIGMILAVCFAAVVPKLGRKGSPFYPQYTVRDPLVGGVSFVTVFVAEQVKYVAVGIIFFLSGLSLKTRELRQSLTYWRFNTYFHAWVFVLMPAIWFTVVLLLRVASCVGRVNSITPRDYRCQA